MKRSLVVFAVLFAPRALLAQPVPEEDPDPVPRAAFSLGSERVDPFYGSFSTDIAIQVPAFSGIEPSLALSYSSSGGNGIAGVGWSLRGFSMIERATPGKGSGSFGFHGSAVVDIFLLDGNELVPCADAAGSPSCLAGGTHAAKIETYQKIARSTGAGFPGDPVTELWTVWRKDGTRMIYSPITTVGGAVNGVARWGLRRVVDVHGNQAVYSWRISTTSPEAYPHSIHYGTSTSFSMGVDLIYEARPDPITYGVGATQLLRTAERLKEIRVVSGGAVRPLRNIYVLSYASSGASGRSILTSVQEMGRDTTYTTQLVPGTSLPPIAMTVPSTGAADEGFASLQDFGARPLFASWSAHWSGDFDGDGDTDLLFVPAAFDGYYVMLSRGSCAGNATPCGFAPPQRWADYAPVADWRSVFVQDLDADGRDDLLYRGVNPGFFAALSTGVECPAAEPCGFLPAAPWGEDVAPTMLDPLHPVDPSALWLRDLDGDGRPDLVYVSSVPSVGIWARFNGGGGFSAPVLLAAVPTNMPQTARQVWLADFNGDAKTDLMYVDSLGLGTARVMLSNGQLLLPPMDWGVINAVPHPSALRVADLNGDGKADVVHLYNFAEYRVLISGGFAFQPAETWAAAEGPIAHLGYDLFTPDLNGDGRADLLVRLGGDFRGRLSTGTAFGAASNWGSYTDVPHLGAVWVQDFTGDGMVDLLEVSTSAGQFLLGENLGSATADLVAEIGNGLGGSMSIEYVPSSAWTRVNAVPRMQTVRAIEVSDGRGQIARTEYVYEDALYEHAERRFLGYRRAVRTLPCVEGESACPYDVLWFRQDLAAASKPERTERRSGSGELLSSVDYAYVTSGSAFPYTALESARTTGEHAGGASRTSRVESEYDTFGNRTFERILGDESVTGDERTVRTLFRPNLSSYIAGLPAAVDVFAGPDTTGALLEQQLFYYDQQTSPRGAGVWDAPPVRGDLTEHGRWSSTTNTFVATRREYDAFGNVTAEEDENARRTVITYDPTIQVFERTRTNAASQVTSTTWDMVCAKPTRVIDPNGETTTTTLDALCRPLRRDLPAGGYVNYRYLDLGAATAQRLRVERPGPAGDVWKDVYFDGLGRTYRTASRGPTAAQVIVTGTIHNARGKPAQVTEAHYEGEPGRTSTIRYDALDRTVEETYADAASVATSHGVGTTVTTDELGHVTTVLTDVFGKQVESRARLEGSDIVTTYVYDERQNLVGIIDHAGNTWSYVYDSLGRRITEDDPDLGLRTYEYDAAGQVTAKIDALAQRTELAYDALGRVTTKTTRAGTPGAAVTRRTYDQVRAGYHNVGRLTRVEDSAGDVTFDFDGAGRWLRRVRTIDGQAFAFERALDTGGRERWIRWPDGDSLGSASTPLAYDDAGQLVSIPGIVDHVEYTADGKVATISNTNGTVTARTYSADRGWMTSLQTAHEERVLQDLTYTHDAEGKITAIASPFVHEAWTYGYDALHRLTTARNLAAPEHGESFAYDALGNLLESSRVGCYGYPAPGSPRPHAPLTAGAHTFAYDDNGNLTSRDGVPLVWDGEDRLVMLGGDTFTYDDDGERVKRTVAGATTLYPADDYEVAPDGTVTKSIRLGALAVAKRTGGATHWLHTDHLGSIQLITGDHGRQVQRYTYRPYGDVISERTNHAESRGYIGERRDPSGLLYLHARYYDPALGVFASADPTWPLDQGVGLNRYAYAGGNPIDRLDPGGEAFILALAPFVANAAVNLALGFAINKSLNQEYTTKDRAIDVALGVAGVGVTKYAQHLVRRAPKPATLNQFREVGREAQEGYWATTQVADAAGNVPRIGGTTRLKTSWPFYETKAFNPNPVKVASTEYELAFGHSPLSWLKARGGEYHRFGEWQGKVFGKDVRLDADHVRAIYETGQTWAHAPAQQTLQLKLRE